MKYLTKGSILLLFIFMGILSAQTEQVITGQTITGSVRWNGTIRIEGDVTIAPSGRLVIDPGTHILFLPGTDKNRSGKDRRHSELIVKGILIAKGTINNKIWFTSASQTPRMEDWYGIRIISPKNTVILEYAVIEYAFNGIVVKKSNPIINNCQLQFNFNCGLSIELGSRPKITGNIISENGYAGIICNTGARPVLTDNMITKNDIGIINFGTAQPNLGNVTKGPQFNSGRNGLFDNLTYNIHNHSVKDIFAQNDSWGSKSEVEIAQTIYDGRDERKYGIVNFKPIMGSTLNLEEKMLLSQNTPSNNTSLSAPVSNKSSVFRSPVETNQSAPSPAQTTMETSSRVQSKPVLTVQDTAHTVPAKEQTIATAVSPSAKRLTVIQESKPTIDYNQVFLDAFLDGGRMILKKVRPVITDINRARNVHGKVIVRVVVGRMGNVESATVLRGLNAYCDGLAMDAARKFIFKPGTVKGNPVRFSTSLFFEF